MILETTEEYYELLMGLCSLEEMETKAEEDYQNVNGLTTKMVSIEERMMSIEKQLYILVKEKYTETEKLREEVATINRELPESKENLIVSAP